MLKVKLEKQTSLKTSLGNTRVGFKLHPQQQLHA